MLQAGQFIINEKYRVLSQAGAGDLGPVYRVLDVETGKICALKTIQLPGSTNDGLLARLIEDTDKVQNLRHPHIASPGRMEETDGNQLFLVREFLEGITLEELIRKEAPLPLHRACSIARQIAQALEAAHHAGIVHGNLKPSSVLLVNEDGVECVKVLGFGFFSAKQDRFVELSKLALTDGDHCLMGAPEYVSPEQAIGTSAEVLDGRSDLYSLGVIWHQMLTGETPFRGGTAMEILLAHLFTEPQPLHGRPELEVPETLDRLLMRTLAKKREDRPASATALVDQLSAWEEPAAPPEPSKPLRDLALEADWAPQAQESAIPETVPPLPLSTVTPSSPPKPKVVLDARWKPPTPEPVVFKPPATPHTPIKDQPLMPREPVNPEPPPAAFSPAAETSFIADIQPSPPAAEEARQSPLDIPLHEEPPVRIASTPAQRSGAAGPTIFGSYAPREIKPPRKGLSGWLVAAIVIVILLGAGCGWLYYSGRTYWFRPDFVKWRISTLLSSVSIPERGTAPARTPPAASQTPAPSTASGRSSARPVPTPAPKRRPQTAAAAAGTPPSSIAPLQVRRQPEAAPKSPPASEAASSRLTAAKTAARRAPAHPQAVKAPLPARSQSATSSTSLIREALARGDHFFERGEYDSAIQVYENGLALDPGNPKLIDGIARAKRAKAAEAKFLGQ